MPSTVPADEGAAGMVHITSNGTGVLLKRSGAPAATRQPVSVREILCLAAICFLFGFAAYIGLMFRTGGL
ncbi:hypothetical protein GHV40_00875 [Devosia sp. D6-9]|nr:hypothetical protein GHV40_00875 [Devosia sp. D6-9]